MSKSIKNIVISSTILFVSFLLLLLPYISEVLHYPIKIYLFNYMCIDYMNFGEFIMTASFWIIVNILYVYMWNRIEENGNNIFFFRNKVIYFVVKYLISIVFSIVSMISLILNMMNGV